MKKKRGSMFIVHRELDTFGRRIKFLRIAWIAHDSRRNKSPTETPSVP